MLFFRFSIRTLAVATNKGGENEGAMLTDFGTPEYMHLEDRIVRRHTQPLPLSIYW